MLLAAQLRRIAYVTVALALVSAPLIGAFPVSVPLSVVVTAAGLLLASRSAADLLASTSWFSTCRSSS